MKCLIGAVFPLFLIPVLIFGESSYTPIGLKLGFGPTRKLPRIDDRKSLHISNIGRLTLGDPRGFGAVQIPSFRPMGVYQPTEQNLQSREWFQNSKFGLFIHWGAYSVLEKGEWVLEKSKLSLEDYESLATSKF